jgi:cell division protein FtsI/penicillin-binding protein 2
LGQKAFKERIGLELLFHAGELHQLLGELVGVQRIERVLVLELRGQDREERVKVLRDRLARRVERAVIC